MSENKNPNEQSSADSKQSAGVDLNAEVNKKIEELKTAAEKYKNEYLYFTATKYTIIILFNITLIKININAQENWKLDNIGIIIANHSSKIDPALFFLIIKRPIKFLAKKQISKYQILNYIFNKFCIYVDRDTQSIPLSSYKSAIAHVNKNNILIIFPEGRRNIDISNSYQPELKNGAFKISNITNKKIGGLAILGASRFMNPSLIVNSRPSISLNLFTIESKYDINRTKKDFINKLNFFNEPKNI